LARAQQWRSRGGGGGSGHGSTQIFLLKCYLLLQDKLIYDPKYFFWLYGPGAQGTTSRRFCVKPFLEKHTLSENYTFQKISRHLVQKKIVPRAPFGCDPP